MKQVFNEDEDEEPKRKLLAKKKIEESSSKDEMNENLKFHDSSSDDDPAQFFESIREEDEIEEMDERAVKEGDFVLVVLGSKKIKRY